MKWKVLLGLLMSAACVPLIVSQIQLAPLGTALRSARYTLLIPAVLVLVCTHLTRTWRWQYILAPVKRLPFFRLLSAMSIGLMANMLLPAHAGEVIRAYLMARRERLGIAVSFASLVVERVADLVSMQLVVVGMLLYTSLSGEQAPLTEVLRIGGYVSALLGGLLLGSLWFIRARTSQAIRCIHVCLAFLPSAWLARLSEALTFFATGLQTLRTGWPLVVLLCLSLCQWVAVVINNALILRAFDLHLPLYGLFFILVVEILGVLMPSAPGFIGTYHAAVGAGLAVFGIPPERALSVAIIMHAAFFFPSILTGLIFLGHESLSLRDLWSVKA